MYGKTALVVLVLSAGVTGCNLICLATRNVVVNPLRYDECLDEFYLRCHASSLADAVLAEMAAGQTEAYSKDYAQGFKQGFVDFIARGSTTIPPPMPPRDYWKTNYQNLEGQAKIRDWFAGFHDGANAASNSGYRQLILVPAALPDPTAPSEVRVSVTGPDSTAEPLPPPRPTDEEKKGSDR